MSYRFSILTLSLLSVFALQGCGGGGSDEPESSLPPFTPPNIGTPTIPSGDFSTGDEIAVTVTASDNDGTPSVSCTDGEATFNLSVTSGNTFSGNYMPASFGVKTITCSASDGSFISDAPNITLSILPNTQEVISNIQLSCENLQNNTYTGGLSPNGLSTLGMCVDAADNIRIGHTLAPLSSSQSEFNTKSFTLAGVSNPHHIVGVELSAEAVSIADAGTVFASEILTQAQIDDIENGYTAILATIEDNMETGVTTFDIMGNFSMDGPTTSIQCGDLALVADDNNIHSLTETLLSANDSFAEGDTLINCSQSVTSATGADESTSLIGKLKVEKSIVQNTAPTINISNITFSEMLTDNTPRDIGEMCATIIAQDASGIESLSAQMVSVSGSVDALDMTLNSNDQYCGELTTFGAESVFIRATAIDNFTESATINSESSIIDMNDNIVISQSSTPSFTTNSGVRSLEFVLDVVDAEGDSFTLSSLTVDTDGLSPGNYSLSVTGRDEISATDVSFDAAYRINAPDEPAPTPVTITDVGSFNGQRVDLNTAGTEGAFYDLVMPSCGGGSGGTLVVLYDISSTNGGRNLSLQGIPGQTHRQTYSQGVIVLENLSASCVELGENNNSESVEMRIDVGPSF